MKHLGDITRLRGNSVPIVDVVTGGSPCQNFSVAGNRKGLGGDESALFYHQVRIVREMREHDRLSGRTGIFIRPRYMVWENVPGAFSSGSLKGADFAAVLEEIIKIAEPDAHIYVCIPDGGWTKSGCYYAEDGTWSIAWRVHDAQFWGVPQRRKRIALVADFGGLSAPEILFERKGLSGDFEKGPAERKEAAGTVGESTEGTEPILIESNQNHATIQTGGVSTSLPASMGMGGGYVPAVLSFQQNASGEVRESTVSYTISTNSNPSGRNTPMCFDARGNGNGEIAPTLTGDHQNRVTDYTGLCVGNGQLNNMSMRETSNPLDTMHDQQSILIAHTLKAKANCDYREDSETYPVQNNMVRRLTPLECERLQGFPDGWTDIGDWTDSRGKKHKAADSPRYKALGNSIALPF